ncbi:MAG: DNA repair protein RecO [Candidatus Paceibacterota bacterium]|jgi:DNA repair protein RecO (recombination protein O)
MYTIYTTPAFILKSSPRGESNQLYTIFTKDFGLLRASAQGVRFLKSKLRYKLQEFNLVEITLVRGKEHWRITNVGHEQSLFTEFKGQKPVLAILARVFNLLRRLLHGEEKNEQLFDHLSETVKFFQSQSLDSSELTNLEYILVLRLLHSLGYLGSSPEVEEFVASPFWSGEVLVKMGSWKKQALSMINQSLQETQL